jgi:5-methylcytosine-specific restriction endonuclease McrA
MAYESLPYIGGSLNSPEWQAKRHELFRKRGGKCEHCGRTLDSSSRKWHLHHKDGNASHNFDDNLEILCKSCHYAAHPFLASHHKALNFRTVFFPRL